MRRPGRKQRVGFVALAAAIPLLVPGIVRGDVLCDYLEEWFDHFPGYYWTVVSGTWTAEGGKTYASADGWAEGVWALSRAGGDDWSIGYFVEANVELVDSLQGELTLFSMVNAQGEGYAFSLDADLDAARLWKGRIHADGTVEELAVLAQADAYGLEAGHTYFVVIDHTEKGRVLCKIDDELVANVSDASYQTGGVAIGYIGPAEAAFDFMCVGIPYVPPCFLSLVWPLDRVLNPFAGPKRRFLLLGILGLGLLGIVRELRARERGLARGGSRIRSA